MFNRPFRWTGCLVLAALSAGLTACENVDRGDGPGVRAVRDNLMEDIPKPAGFQLVDDRSIARVSGQFRVARVEYSGSGDRQQVKRFYETNLPNAGFELKKTSLDQGIYGLSFESATEECDVRIRKSGLKTIIVIEIGPKPVGSTERDTSGMGAPPARRRDK